MRFANDQQRHDRLSTGGPAGLPRMRLRIPPSRPVVGIDEFAVEPLRTRMRMSERLLEIPHLQALLHYGRIVVHEPGNYPVRAIPSQNLFDLGTVSDITRVGCQSCPTRGAPGTTGLTIISGSAGGCQRKPSRSPRTPSRLPSVRIRNRPSSP
jgi:hypothetical protein